QRRPAAPALRWVGGDLRSADRALRARARARGLRSDHPLEGGSARPAVGARGLERRSGSARAPVIRLLEIDPLHAPVSAGEEQRVVLAGDLVGPPAAGADELAEHRRGAVAQAIDVDAAHAPAGADDGAVAFDVEQPTPPVAIARDAIDRRAGVPQIER